MPPRLPIHITLFTRTRCALCTTAHSNLARAWQLRPFEFSQIDVMGPGQERWKAVYEFSVPVVHVARTVGEGDGVREEWRVLRRGFAAEEVVDVWEELVEEGRV
ncbi:hypothetical protein Q9L58_009438 [Maublancomyces gigas]|uniref:Glutaredoxin-like protein n=1 Tax=Discina gigas TaxID=1032678 RepID=A0ABR3G6X4_9PEZI